MAVQSNLYLNHADIIDTLRPKQYFADNTFNRIFLNEHVRISIEISLKFVPEGQNNNIPVLVQIMAWRRPGDKPLSEPMMIRLRRIYASFGLNVLMVHVLDLMVV